MTKPQIRFLALVFLCSAAMSSYSQYDENRRYYRVVATAKHDSTIESTSNEVSVVKQLNVHVPTGFTPNSDGLNDFFTILGSGVERFQLQVFNRWGELIFKSQSLNNKWDGYYKGSIVPMGVYVYKLTAVSADKKESLSKSGTVTVGR